MYLLLGFYKLELLCTILLALVAVIGDCLVNYFNLQVYKALFDNSTHSIIGGLTWFIINLRFRSIAVPIRLAEVFLCAFIASIIDLDHFIAARSLRLKDATNLQDRPILHCSTIPLVVTVVLLIVAHLLMSETIYRFSWILFAAFTSHHVRDATRRGLWFYNFDSTPPIPYYMYIFTIMLIPHLVGYFMKLFYVQHNQFDDIVNVI